MFQQKIFLSSLLFFQLFSIRFAFFVPIGHPFFNDIHLRHPSLSATKFAIQKDTHKTLSISYQQESFLSYNNFKTHLQANNDEISNSLSPSSSSLSSPSSSSSIIREKITKRTVTLTKPMGLILEQDVIDEDTSEMGVIQVVKIDPNGNTAKSNQDICIGDWILEVNGNHCFHHLENDHETNNKDEPNTHPNMTLEQVIDIIIQSPSTEISLTLGRPEQSVILKFANGINIATTPGAYLKQLASTALVPIPYSCDSGGCGTCEQIMRIPRKDNDKDGGNDNCGDLWDERYVRPCVARVPKGSNTILISPSDRLEVD